MVITSTNEVLTIEHEVAGVAVWDRTTSGSPYQIRSYLKVDFLHDANTSMGHGSKK